ncbi:diacylglycerol kinase family protein [Arthrobacter sp. Sr33]
MKLLVAVNPTAGAGAAKKAASAAVTSLIALGHEVTVLAGPSYATLVDRVSSAVAERSPDALVVVGGDGMVQLGANVLAGTTVPLGIVATGTGNDVARTLGLPLRDPEAAALVIHEALPGPPHWMDLGRISRDQDGAGVLWFAGACSAGFDAIVNARANTWSWPRGKSRYTLAVLRELAVFRPIGYRLVIDGSAESTAAMLVSVANGRSIGGGMKITPDALCDDGLLDLLVVSAVSRLRLIAMLPRLFAGTHVSHPAVRIEKVRSVRVEVAGLTVFADGEPVGPAPVQIDVVPRALRVLRPVKSEVSSRNR